MLAYQNVGWHLNVDLNRHCVRDLGRKCSVNVHVALIGVVTSLVIVQHKLFLLWYYSGRQYKLEST